MDVSVTLAKLIEKRTLAEGRIGEIEGEQRQAVQAREAARAALIEFERRGGAGRRAERVELERKLNEAEAHAVERWPERIEGARRAARDQARELQVFTHEHLDELLEIAQRDGELAAEAVTKAAQTLVDAYQRREQIAGEIAQLVSGAGISVRPGDITFSRCEQAAKAAGDLITNGGEEPPKLRRDPRQPIHGELVEAVS